MSLLLALSHNWQRNADSQLELGISDASQHIFVNHPMCIIGLSQHVSRFASGSCVAWQDFAGCNQAAGEELRITNSHNLISAGVDALLDVLSCVDTFGSLEELNVVGCSLQYDQLCRLLLVVGADAQCGRLHTLEIGANPGVNNDGFEGVLEKCRAARPGLDIHWRSGDHQHGSAD